MSPQEIISQLGLVPLKFEGGWVKEFGTSPSGHILQSLIIVSNVVSIQGMSSSIYYMVHRVGVDEYWCHHSGGNIRSPIKRENMKMEYPDQT